MNNKLVNMLEDIKTNKYTIYSNYLNDVDIENISKWYGSFALNEQVDFEIIINLMYELYIREDIDSRPYEDYKRLTTYFADKYRFKSVNFLDIYRSFRNLLFV